SGRHSDATSVTKVVSGRHYDATGVTKVVSDRRSLSEGGKSTNHPMPFQLLPILDQMYELYQKPRDFNRFKEYLALLMGDSRDDMELPIGNFNPMAKEHALEKLDELRALKAEAVAAAVLTELNGRLQSGTATGFKVVLSLADDLKGGWTNRFTTDHASKFRIGPLVKRHFCTPVFWTGEDYNPDKIRTRIKEYVFRTVYRSAHPNPETLKDHIDQEVYVAKMAGTAQIYSGREEAAAFYQANAGSDNYAVLLNFLYGDAAAAQLGYRTLGIEEDAGYQYARHLAL
ncbi:MAG TPA: hypothetical protein PKE06_02650, partial [Flavilitoribacter sp.]|nr:hypothetical protein [Flavilitoribacter sp.]HMQ87754.1 hypothetical protein [Flavilitoribacter sp.]